MISKLLFRYKNEMNKPVDVVMDPRELTHMEFIRGERILYNIYSTKDDFDAEVDRLTKLSNGD